MTWSSSSGVDVPNTLFDLIKHPSNGLYKLAPFDYTQALFQRDESPGVSLLHSVKSHDEMVASLPTTAPLSRAVHKNMSVVLFLFGARKTCLL